MKTHSAIGLILALFVRDSLASCSLVLAFYTIILHYQVGFNFLRKLNLFTLLNTVSFDLKVAGHFVCKHGGAQEYEY